MKYNSFEDLQQLGIEKIHERTHISRDKVILILNKSFEQIGHVQFMGFISILEREFEIDLSTIRDEYSTFRKQHDCSLPPKESVILQATTNDKQKWIALGVGLILLLSAGGYYVQNFFSNSPSEELIRLSEVITVPDPEGNQRDIVESNITSEDNKSIDLNVSVLKPIDRNTTLVEETKMAVGSTLRIHPIYKVWYGIIDTSSGSREHKITSEDITIDCTKRWLIVLGHGRVEIISGNEKKTLKDRGTVRFLCENGILKPLSKEEFIEHNGGENW